MIRSNAPKRLNPWKLVLLVPLWAVAQPCLGREKSEPMQRACDAIDAFVARSMEKQGTPGLTLAVTTRDAIVYVGTYGYADLKLKRPVTKDTLFQIGSITKSFTALALMQCCDEGKFDPQQPVAKSLPWFHVHTDYAPIRAHHLLTHTAGIPANRDDMPAVAVPGFCDRPAVHGLAARHAILLLERGLPGSLGAT